MEMQITTHTFKTDGEWETIDYLWYSPFFYWQKNGVRVTPTVPLRLIAGFGTWSPSRTRAGSTTEGPARSSCSARRPAA
jgi:hypothetical protein